MSTLFTNRHLQTINLSNGDTITLETGKFARQADGSVMLRVGKTAILATVVSSDPNPDLDFFPLTVEYKEKFSAAGRFPGGFFKREARPSDQEILNCRLVDRTIRPVFPEGFRGDTQVILQLISFDPRYLPDSFIGLAASAAIAISDVPFTEPVSCIRVLRVDGEFVVNPSQEMVEKADMDMVIGASANSVMMVEGEMDEISEEEMLEAIQFAHEKIKEVIVAQEEMMKTVGKPKKEFIIPEADAEMVSKIEPLREELTQIISNSTAKAERSEAIKEVYAKFEETLSEAELERVKEYKGVFSKLQKEITRAQILNHNTRLDGRKTDEIRPIECEIDLLPNAHGSALFTRGETQSLSTATLGTSLDANRIDTVTTQGEEKFYLHYNFPPFSTGEARPLRGTSRREIGHGNLAQRALTKVIPEDNPYTVRVLSEILESNGSSSMATVCAGTLALMDAGIQITAPVSGIAMGLISDEETGNFAVLSDILGDEDAMGDMDFKVTGTEKGITACQMDIKINGLSYDILSTALEQSKKGRLHILSKITDTIAAPRASVKDGVPTIVNKIIDKEFIGAVIGPAGKVIQGLQEETGTTIVIEEKEDGGHIEIMGTDQAMIKKAIKKIEAIVFVPEVGTVYQGKVKSIKPFGAFIAIAPNCEALLHISEITWERLESVESVLKEGQDLEVKLVGKDPKTGKYRLSRKVLLPKKE